jgi:hypothetical protein
MSDKSLIYRLAELINAKIAASKASNDNQIVVPEVINLDAQNDTTNNNLLTDRIWNEADVSFLRDNIANFDLLLQITDPILYDKLYQSENQLNKITNPVANSELKEQEQNLEKRLKDINNVSQEFVALALMVTDALFNLATLKKCDVDKIIDELADELADELELVEKEQEQFKSVLKDVISVSTQESYEGKKDLLKKLEDVSVKNAEGNTLNESALNNLMEKSVELISKKIQNQTQQLENSKGELSNKIPSLSAADQKLLGECKKSLRDTEVKDHENEQYNSTNQESHQQNKKPQIQH